MVQIKDHPTLIILGTISASITLTIAVFVSIVIPTFQKRDENEIASLRSKVAFLESEIQKGKSSAGNAPQGLAINSSLSEAAVSQVTTKSEAEKIVEDISRSDPYLLEQAKLNYVDQKIKWRLYLSHIKIDAPGKVFVAASTSVANTYPSIWFSADIKQYPFLKTLKRNAPIEVLGAIKGFEGDYTIKIEPVNITPM